MRWLVHLDPVEFEAVAGAHLRAAPLVNQMPLGVLATLRTDPARYPVVRLRSVSRDGACVGVLVHTPPWNPTLSAADPDVAALMGGAYAAETYDLFGVFGEEEAANAFAEAAVTGSGQHAELEGRMGLFELRQVNPVPAVPGRMRLADAADARLLQAWGEAFHAEAVPHDPPPTADTGVRYATNGRVHLWLSAEGTPVSFAAFGREIEGFVSVGPVYTPPEARGHGYATALVAAMSRQALASGRHGCTLFTDLANPISNAIYEKIGYRRVGTMARVRFVEG